MKNIITYNNYSATIDTLGAEVLELKKDDSNILWNRDPKYWADSALVLFPFIGRNYNDTYTYDGKAYNIGIHGFASKSEFTLINKTESSITLLLIDTEETYKVYPFNFNFAIEYILDNKGLSINYTIVNESNKDMYFTAGYHPGFILNKSLDNYSIEFINATNPEEICIVTKCMLTGVIKPFELTNKTLQLSKDLFLNSARILQGVGDTVILKENDKPIVTLTYNNFENIVLWQTLNSDAPFVCIEGWRGLPGKYEQIEEISEVNNKTSLKPKESYSLSAQIKF